MSRKKAFDTDLSTEVAVSEPEQMHVILTDLFNDRRFRLFERGCYIGEVEGRKVGVVIAVRSSPQYANHAMPAEPFDRLLAALREGRLDAAYVVLIEPNGTGRPAVRGAMEAETLAPQLEPARSGMLGPFYLVPPDFDFNGTNAPF
jgi:hypothetical protein